MTKTTIRRVKGKDLGEVESYTEDLRVIFFKDGRLGFLAFGPGGKHGIYAPPQEETEELRKFLIQTVDRSNLGYGPEALNPETEWLIDGSE